MSAKRRLADVDVLDRVHGGYVHRRRVTILSEEISRLCVPAATLLDVGSGDGWLASLIGQRIGSAQISGIDTLVRRDARIPIAAFDGRSIPYGDRSFDYVMLIDVLHHTDDPMILLREARRVARRAVLIKDHLLEGFLAGPTLRFMDWVGNARHGVVLPFNYWPLARWREALTDTGLTATYWNTDVALYPPIVNWLFGRSLHVVARLEPDGRPKSPAGHPALPARLGAPEPCCSTPWEDAYARFETPEQEVAKFTQRLRELGEADWPRDARVVELFCGRGNGLHALHQLGFTAVEGADLSASLLAQYHGPATCYVCDCRTLPFDGRSRDIAIVQGGLHHLAQLPEDLAMTLAEIARVLKPGGRLVVVEPWLTPFLRLAHFACDVSVCRRAFAKVDALATMIEHERGTYEAWLSQPGMILALLRRHFEAEVCRVGWGKLMFVGRRSRDG